MSKKLEKEMKCICKNSTHTMQDHGRYFNEKDIFFYNSKLINQCSTLKMVKSMYEWL